MSRKRMKNYISDKKASFLMTNKNLPSSTITQATVTDLRLDGRVRLFFRMLSVPIADIVAVVMRGVLRALDVLVGGEGGLRVRPVRNVGAVRTSCHTIHEAIKNLTNVFWFCSLKSCVVR